MEITTKISDIEEVAPLEHYFSDGVYCRVGTIPADTFMVGYKHLTNHLNILLTGKMAINISGEVRVIEAPYIFEALADSVKAVITYTECRFMNIHPTDTKNLDEIRARVVDPNMTTETQKLYNSLKEIQCGEQ